MAPDSSTPQDTSFAHRVWVPFALYGLMAVLLALVVVPTWGWTYWDFGDGNYLYIARRVREGLVLYRDILAPQPPLHTLAGVWVQSLGAIFRQELAAVRLYCLLSRVAAGLLVLLLAWRLFRCPFRGLAAAAIYLTMPIGFWWSLGYQSENLEIVFLLLALWLLLRWEPRAAVVAGAASALACHCNMTGVPFLFCNVLFLAFRRPKLLPWYLGSALFVFSGGAVAAALWTGGAYLDNVLFNQVGTFPRTDILSAAQPGDSFAAYVLRKVPAEFDKVLDLEGGLMALAAVGVLLHLARTPFAPASAPEEERARWLNAEFLAWSAIGMGLSICFTAKGGTVNYIFVLGEPPIAIFAAHTLVLAFRLAVPAEAGHWRSLSLWNTRAALMLAFPLLVGWIVVRPVVGNIRATLTEQQTELPEAGALKLRGFIETYAEPGDVILAPPFYAYLTRTRVAGELAENYIWQIKYLNETFDAANYGRPTGEAVVKMQEIAGLLARREVKVVLLDLDQTGRVPEVKAALEEHYQLAEPEPFHTRNTRLGLYIPKDVSPHHIPLR